MKSESVFALIAGAAVGVAVGMLLARDNGGETCRKIKETVKDGYDKAKDRMEDEIVRLKSLLETEGENLKEAARKKILEQLDRLEKALSEENEVDEQTQEA
ncbi:MAG: YtxH domain-containing protein [Candidatus Cryptobacteroides sp.]|nr:YtxH domain-containing protein [Bacteroidales bacterium]